MIYLDYTASGVPFREAMEVMYHAPLRYYAHPGALHTPGGDSQALLLSSRRKMAQLFWGTGAGSLCYIRRHGGKQPGREIRHSELPVSRDIR